MDTNKLKYFLQNQDIQNTFPCFEYNIMFITIISITIMFTRIIKITIITISITSFVPAGGVGKVPHRQVVEERVQVIIILALIINKTIIMISWQATRRSRRSIPTHPRLIPGPSQHHRIRIITLVVVTITSDNLSQLLSQLLSLLLSLLL